MAGPFQMHVNFTSRSPRPLTLFYSLKKKMTITRLSYSNTSFFWLKTFKGAMTIDRHVCWTFSCPWPLILFYQTLTLAVTFGSPKQLVWSDCPAFSQPSICCCLLATLWIAIVDLIKSLQNFHRNCVSMTAKSGSNLGNLWSNTK